MLRAAPSAVSGFYLKNGPKSRVILFSVIRVTLAAI